MTKVFIVWAEGQCSDCCAEEIQRIFATQREADEYVTVCSQLDHDGNYYASVYEMGTYFGNREYWFKKQYSKYVPKALKDAMTKFNKDYWENR